MKGSLGICTTVMSAIRLFKCMSCSDYKLALRLACRQTDTMATGGTRPGSLVVDLAVSNQMVSGYRSRGYPVQYSRKGIVMIVLNRPGVLLRPARHAECCR
jgi:hypothetical protein